MAEPITGRIYRIVSDSHPEVLPYYGSTTSSLKQRWSSHKSPSNESCSTQLMIFDDVRIELVEEFVCESIRTLRQREQWYIDNHECCNQQRAFILDIKAKYQMNKENYKAYSKNYYEANKEAISIKRKAYYQSKKKI
jgi:hypothetical protein